jgi:creatinine amidohydrolase/Fe(II)-dependent formamide hydrolase-like protein/ribosomal protein S18 acetylase RimI-like enzyme
LITGDNTTVEWQSHPTDIIVLPIGAIEQHDAHLPLDTDSIRADYFGRMIAEEFDAALLPTIRIASSMEHTGFRGSFSLKPETLMQVIRDIADDSVRQNFKIMIVANSHGGNHSLTPVCRDINRRDGALKILLVDLWTFADPTISETSSFPGINIHAGESETSIIMTLKPDLVKKNMQDAQYKNEIIPLKQSDLTTFGIGHFNPNGALGFPSYASKEKGDRLIDSIRNRMLPFIRDRIERLRILPLYSGKGGLAIRSMTSSDIPEVMRLKTIAGWNQIEADWDLYLNLSPQGCFVMVHLGRPVGTITTVNYGNILSWIGMVIVDPEYRRMGIASRLMNHAIKSLADCKIIKLDATPEGNTVYNKLGFVDEYTLSRMTGTGFLSDIKSNNTVRLMTSVDLIEINKMDIDIFGVERSNVINHLYDTSPDNCFILINNNSITAYCFTRPGINYTQLGPICALNSSDAISITAEVLKSLHGNPVVIDVPDSQDEYKSWLQNIGFAFQRPFIRMAKGNNPQSKQISKIFAIAGPELG